LRRCVVSSNSCSKTRFRMSVHPLLITYILRGGKAKAGRVRLRKLGLLRQQFPCCASFSKHRRASKRPRCSLGPLAQPTQCSITSRVSTRPASISFAMILVDHGRARAQRSRAHFTRLR
jgi:hypothetical protein